MELSQSIIDFEQILIGKQMTKYFKVRNNGLLPVRFIIKNPQELSQWNFQPSFEKNIIERNQEETIQVTFSWKD